MAALVDQQHPQPVAADPHRPHLQVLRPVGAHVHADQLRVRTERPCEHDQAVQQRPCRESVPRQRERCVDRVGADVDVDAVDAGAQQLEQRVGRPQCGCERVAHPRQPAAGDGVQLGQAERKSRTVGEPNRGLELTCHPRRGTRAQQPRNGGIGGQERVVHARRVRVAVSATIPSPGCGAASRLAIQPRSRAGFATAGPTSGTPGANERVRARRSRRRRCSSAARTRSAAVARALAAAVRTSSTRSRRCRGLARCRSQTRRCFRGAARFRLLVPIAPPSRAGR